MANWLNINCLQIFRHVTLTYNDELWEIKNQIDFVEYDLAMENNNVCKYMNE
jgi:hypothetical protein